MAIFKLEIASDAGPVLMATTNSPGPILVEASDEATARVIAKTNFWAIEPDPDGFPTGADCIWVDRHAVQCEALSVDPNEFRTERAQKRARIRAMSRPIVCPDFDLGNGRYAKMVWWPVQPGDRCPV